MPVKKYIHIGYNKSFSTSLQTSFFAVHEDLYHMGVGYEGANLGYIDSKIEIAVEQHLRFSKDFVFDRVESKITDAFHNHFLAAEKSGKKYAGISSEHLSFNLTPDNIDITTKARRLHRIFGADTKIIMVIRNQIDFFRSMYREAIRGGYHLSFADYIDYVYKFQARNFVPDYLYDQTYQLYADLFGAENIQVIVMEEVRDTTSKDLLTEPDGSLSLIKKITDFLDISDFPNHFDYVNPSLADDVTSILRHHNFENRHGLSNTLYDAEQTHRLRTYFKEELSCNPPYADEDWKKKWANIDAATSKAQKNNHAAPEIDFSCDQELLDRLKRYYVASNDRLQNILGIDLSKLKYPTSSE